MNETTSQENGLCKVMWGLVCGSSYFPQCCWDKLHGGKRTVYLRRRKERNPQQALRRAGWGKELRGCRKVQSICVCWRDASTWGGGAQADSAGPQLGVGLAGSAKLLSELPRHQQVFSSHEFSCHCPCPSSSPNTTTGPLIFFQRAGSMPRTSCHLWVMVSEHRTSPEESEGSGAPGPALPKVHWSRRGAQEGPCVYSSNKSSTVPWKPHWVAGAEGTQEPAKKKKKQARTRTWKVWCLFWRAQAWQGYWGNWMIKWMWHCSSSCKVLLLLVAVAKQKLDIGPTRRNVLCASFLTPSSSIFQQWVRKLSECHDCGPEFSWICCRWALVPSLVRSF